MTPTEGQTTTLSGADVLALPTLPHPMLMPPLDNGDYQLGYDADDMQEYAREAVTDAVAALIARNAELAEQIIEGKQQWDRVAKTIGADCDCVDDVFAKADALAAKNKALRADTERWRDVAQRFSCAKTSASERILEDLKYPADQPWLDLAEIVDGALARTPAKGDAP